MRNQLDGKPVPSIVAQMDAITHETIWPRGMPLSYHPREMGLIESTASHMGAGQKPRGQATKCRKWLWAVGRLLDEAFSSCLFPNNADINEKY
jgi:hypothetical protein